MRRSLAPELLDTLPAEDPSAIGARRDLQRVNAVMRHGPLCEAAIERLLEGRAPRSLVELGCGDAKFLAGIARRKSSAWTPLEVWLVDRVSIVSASTLQVFEAAGWNVHPVQADVFEWLKTPAQAEVCLMNLFLHHFEAEQIATLMRGIASYADAFVACEPRRSVRALWASHVVGLLGCNAVTRHDAVVSVRAGFAGREISRLWDAGGAWELSEGAAGTFSHLFTARRTKTT